MQRLLAAAVLGSFAAATGAEDAVARFYGYAYHLDSGRYAFTQILEQRQVGGQWVDASTVYYLPDGSEFGRKTLDFSRDPFVPVYRLELKDGHAEGISDNGGRIAMSREFRGKVESGTAEKTGVTTADAGLSRLLHAHFEELRRGETLAFRVVAPSRLATYRFRARRAEDAMFEGKAAVRIQVDMDSMLRMLAGPLFFTFDPQSVKLLEFRGPTNVVDPSTGEPFKVRISYYSAPPGDVPVLPPLPK